MLSCSIPLHRNSSKKFISVSIKSGKDNRIGQKRFQADASFIRQKSGNTSAGFVYLQEMNFLSHFYFDRHCNDAYHVLGSVMPDLLRNADKNAQVKIERLPPQNDAAINSIINGWKKHLEIDRYFHSSLFFKTHSHQLKLLFVPILAGSEVKPFFLGHIALELILDNLLLTNHTVFADDFYDHLKNAQTENIAAFLELNHVDPQKFLNFYAAFIHEKYLYS
ncbi:MAG: hypothetical protein EOP42_16880, partial [Sphingobacteriaceae bacterium]